MNYIVYYLLYKFTGIDALAYNIIAWMAAVIFAFFTNKLLVMGIHELIAKLVISVIVVIVNYFASKLFIFKKEKGDSNE